MEGGSRFRGRKYGTRSQDLCTMLGMVYVVQVWWGYRLPRSAQSEKWCWKMEPSR